MSFDFNKAVELYKKNPTKEGLDEAAEKLLSQMTLKEKIRMMKGHAMGVTIKNVFTRGRYYNGEAYPAGGCKRLGIPPVLFTDGQRQCRGYRQNRVLRINNTGRELTLPLNFI